MSRKQGSIIKDVITDILLIGAVNIVFIIIDFSGWDWNIRGGENYELFGIPLQDFFTNVFAPYDIWVFNFVLVSMIVVYVIAIIYRAIRRNI
ncbi:YfzA family protein [Oceanobacillus jeddahense]|uniref:YfzA family protein n=1 Tax=Oceanobacillus jeddahense TaxID=1462527 RepID=UPI000595F7CC|nr:YfzA family protein [Oceanobacillus jeddahense]